MSVIIFDHTRIEATVANDLISKEEAGWVVAADGRAGR
jgi:hypothetical protein